MKNYYEVLGVPRNATPKEIKKAAKEKSFKIHPAKDVKNGVENEKKQKEIQEAKYFLLNDERRKAYDETLPPEPEELIIPPDVPPPPSARPKPEKPPTPPPKTVYEVGPVVKRKTFVDIKVEPKAKPKVSKNGDDSAFWKTLFTTCSIISMLAITFALIFNSIGVSDKKIDTFVKGSREDPKMIDFYGEMDYRKNLGCKFYIPGVIGDLDDNGNPKEHVDTGCSKNPNYKSVLRPVAAAK